MLDSLKCLVCGATFTRPTSRGRTPDYCSLRCRRELEQRRKLWDRLQKDCSDDGYYVWNRDMDGRDALQRRNWQRQLDRARREFAKMGPRP